jgi:hypothetical protein
VCFMVTMAGHGVLRLWWVLEILIGLGLVFSGPVFVHLRDGWGEGWVRTMRGRFRVTARETDVVGVFVAPLVGLPRCFSIAEASLSLSLSLLAGVADF